MNAEAEKFRRVRFYGVRDLVAGLHAHRAAKRTTEIPPWKQEMGRVMPRPSALPPISRLWGQIGFIESV